MRLYTKLPIALISCAFLAQPSFAELSYSPSLNTAISDATSYLSSNHTPVKLNLWYTPSYLKISIEGTQYYFDAGEDTDIIRAIMNSGYPKLVERTYNPLFIVKKDGQTKYYTYDVPVNSWCSNCNSWRAYISGNHAVYTMEDHTNDATLVIDGNTYFVQTEDEALKNLINKGMSGLKTTDNLAKALFELGDENKTYYTFDLSQMVQSLYNVSSGSENNYSFSTSDGSQKKYWKIEINENILGTSNSFAWEDVTSSIADPFDLPDDVIKVRLPNNEIRYVKYTYTQPDGYIQSDRLISPDSDIENGIFENVSFPNQGGAIYNKDNAEDLNIKAEFIANISSDESYNANTNGGAIYNENSSIGEITGNFLNNNVYSAHGMGSSNGGAIYNAQNAYIGKITGDFVGNYLNAANYYVFGGAVYNLGEINDISGNFINNYVWATGTYATAEAGAIYNGGKIGNINGSFINNYSYSVGNYSSEGGAIVNSGEIGSITGDFINNRTTAAYRENNAGGAISNSGIIRTITGDFINNRSAKYAGAIMNNGIIEVLNSNFVNNYSDIMGGTIYNVGEIKNIVGQFIGNHVAGSPSVEEMLDRWACSSLDEMAQGHGYANIEEMFESYNVSSAEELAAALSNEAQGGAISNGGMYNRNGDGIIGNIYADFIGNYAVGTHADGGAIFNRISSIGNIVGNFIDNYAHSVANVDFMHAPQEEWLCGGAIFNYSSSIESITGDFVNNHYQADYVQANGGAIFNEMSTIGALNGNFVSNYAYAENNRALGGAIYNDGDIKNVTGDFIDNYAYGKTGAWGGAIFNVSYNDRGGDVPENNIDLVNSSFIGNYAVADSNNHVSAVENLFAFYGVSTAEELANSFGYSDEESMLSEFGVSSSLDDFAYSNSYNNIIDMLEDKGYSIYDAILADLGYADVDEMLDSYGDEFSEELIASDLGYQSADEMYDAYTLSSAQKMAKDMGFADVDDMLDGYESFDQMARVWGFSDYDSLGGGAIYNQNGNVNLTASDGKEVLISGNYIQEGNAEKDYQAIYMNGGVLTLTAKDGGQIIIDDKIEGNDYTLIVSEDGSENSCIKFNNVVTGVETFAAPADTAFHLGLGADIQTANMKVVSSLRSPAQRSLQTPTINVDVKIKDDQSGYDSGQIHVSGDVEGQYSVIVNALTPDVLSDLEAAKTAFLFAPNDDAGTASGFSVTRVIGNPYLWEAAVNVNGETEGSTWYLNLTNRKNPDYGDGNSDVIVVAPEVLAGVGVGNISLQQNSGMARNIRSRLMSKPIQRTAEMVGHIPNNRLGTWVGDHETSRSVWAFTEGQNAKIKAPANTDAKVWSVDAGLDIQKDMNNVLGVFTAYRRGDYDIKAKGGEKYISSIGSDVKVNSWLGGLYYRYEKGNNWAFATIYGGLQKVKTKTQDGVAKFDTDGIEAGASIELGHAHEISETVTIEPSFGVFYTYSDMDKAKDNVGKEYHWDKLHHTEFELGVKLDKKIGDKVSNIYVKPSLIQTYTRGDTMKVTGMNKIDTYKDGISARLEVGAQYNFTDKLSGYGWTHYTYGKDYEAITGGLGVRYSW